MQRYLDLQVNGYAGVDFNADDVPVESIVVACERLRSHGVESILATLITDDVERMCHRIQTICRARTSNVLVADVICGFHLEGPFLNPQPGYIGAHPAEFALPADLGLMQQLFDAAEGLLRIVTLAPECDAGSKVTRWLADRRVIVSAGHCDPTLDQLRASIDRGLSMFTHLGNGCPLQLNRHDNIIQRVLRLADHLMIGFIADGIHVPFFALENYLQVSGCDRAFIVTDAVAAAGQGSGRYRLANQDVIVDKDLATWSADKSHLVGSAMTMPRVVENLRIRLQLSDLQIRKLTRENALRILGNR